VNSDRFVVARPDAPVPGRRRPVTPADPDPVSAFTSATQLQPDAVKETTFG